MLVKSCYELSFFCCIAITNATVPLASDLDSDGRRCKNFVHFGIANGDEQRWGDEEKCRPMPRHMHCYASAHEWFSNGQLSSNHQPIQRGTSADASLIASLISHASAVASLIADRCMVN